MGLARNSVLESKARPYMETAKIQCEQTRQKQRVFGEFDYGAATWDRTRRVIVKAEHLDKGGNPRFIVTNRPGEPRDLYEDLYCQRGQMENRIKE